MVNSLVGTLEKQLTKSETGSMFILADYDFLVNVNDIPIQFLVPLSCASISVSRYSLK